MSRRRHGAAIVLVSALALASALAPGAGARGANTIKVDDNRFRPAAKTVAKDTRVRFKWVGSNEHDVVKKSGPGGAFGSGITAERGVNLKKKFGKRGTYRIICNIHEEMKLKLEVD